MILIKNANVIDPLGNREYQADIFIKNKKIQEISCEIQVTEEMNGVLIIDACGKTVIPGLVDTHVHFRDPGFTYKEDIVTGARAAARGGFTTVILMANTSPAVDNAGTLAYVLKRGRQTGIHVESCVNVTKGMEGKELTDMEELASLGAAGFTDDGIPLMNEKLVREAMERARLLHKPISFHEEDPSLISNNGINAGKASAYYQVGGSPREAEIMLVERDLNLALETGAEVIIQHISTKEAVELVRRAKLLGGRVHAEATPHHFTLTEEAVIQYGTMAKMNPPLREEADRQEIIRGLVDGTIDMIATDHAPHSREEKERPITEAPSGMIGLETALSLGIRELVNQGYLTLPELIYRMSTAPAQLYGINAGKLEAGAPADLVIFDLQESWRVNEFISKSDNSPFVGQEMPGVVYDTICNGEIIYDKQRSSDISI